MLLWVFRGAELAVHKIFLKKCSKKFRNTREKTQLRGEITILLDQGKNVNISFQSLSTSSLCILAFILIISTITITSLTSASETYPKTCQTSKMEGLMKTINGEICQLFPQTTPLLMFDRVLKTLPYLLVKSLDNVSQLNRSGHHYRSWFSKQG